MASGFKTFLLRGNLVDLAVGIVIGNYRGGHVLLRCGAVCAVQGALRAGASARTGNEGVPALPQQHPRPRDALPLLHDRPLASSQYSSRRVRFLHEMRGRVLRLIGEVVSVRPVVVKPLVLLAAKVIGPGPLRLKMVRLAHELDDREVSRVAG